MKKKLFFIFILLISFLSLAKSSYALQAEAYKTSGIIIDGNVEDWGNALSYTVNKVVLGSTENVAMFKTLWDSNNLYVLVQVFDNSLINDSLHLYEDDSVEIYIDGLNDKSGSYGSDDKQYIISINKTIIDYGVSVEKKSFPLALVKESNGYNLEIAIPFSDIGIIPSDNKIIGFDLGVNDDDNGTAREGQIMWNGDGTGWNNTTQFGNLLLSSTAIKYYFYGQLKDKNNNPLKASININSYSNSTDLQGNYFLQIVPGTYDVNYSLQDFWVKVNSFNLNQNKKDLVNYITKYDNKLSFTLDFNKEQVVQLYSSYKPVRILINGTEISNVTSLSELKNNTWFYNSSEKKLYINTSLNYTPSCDSLSYPSDKWQRVWYVHSTSSCLGNGPDETSLTFDNNWGTGTIAYSKSDDIEFFSSRTINIQTTGTYTFTVGSDDGIRLWVDDVLRIDKWVDRAYTTDSVDVALTAGNHKIRIDWYENSGAARVYFNYTLAITPGTYIRGVDEYVYWLKYADIPFSSSITYTRNDIWKGLNLNTLRLMGPYNKDVILSLGISLSANQTNWDINLNELLDITYSHGYRVVFYTLGGVYSASEGYVGELGIKDTLYGATPVDITTAKKYIDLLENSPNLHHNFITDKRILMWSIGNECPIGTVPYWGSNNVTLNSNYYWMIELAQYIRSKGGKVSFPHPYLKVATGGSDWRIEAVLPYIDKYVDYLDWHVYGTWDLTKYYCTKKPVCNTTGDTGGSQIGTIISYGQYDWEAWENWLVTHLENIILNRGNHSLDQIIITEFGIHHGYANSYGAVVSEIPWAFSDEDCINYFTHYFNALKRVNAKYQPGLQNLIIHHGIATGWRVRYPDTFGFNLALNTGQKRADYDLVASYFQYPIK